MLYHENKACKDGFRFIIGVDEVGRGPLAGPVVACAVILKKRKFKNRIDDSKKLSPQQREKAFQEIYKHSTIGIGIINEASIDEMNIFQASRAAMENAVKDLISKFFPKKELKHKKILDKIYVLIDGAHLSFDFPFKYKNIIAGDSKSLSIACASIAAKVIRDRIMCVYDRLYPGYGFSKHKGYATKMHLEAIKVKGPSLAHRKSFSPIKEIF